MVRAHTALLVSALLCGCQSADAVTGGARPLSGGSAAGARDGDAAAVTPAGSAPRTRLLVFSKTAGFRHDSIPAGIAAVQRLGHDHAFDVEATEDATWFTSANLARFNAIVFLSTSGDILDDAQQQAFEAFIKSGGGFVGVHSAADTEYDWPFYRRLMGAAFLRHPAGTPTGTIRVVDHAHRATAHLGATWQRVDEWYTLQSSPAEQPEVHVLLALDEDSIPLAPEFRMGVHPLAWFQARDGGRAFSTVLGHTTESYSEPAFLQHLWGGIEWAATGARDPATLVHELDGIAPPGRWVPDATPFPFDFAVTKDALAMFDAGGNTQHLTRADVTVGAGRPYTIEALFTIPTKSRNALTDEHNAFSIDFDVQGAKGSADDLTHLSSRSLGLDLSRASPHTGVIETVGFVDGVRTSAGASGKHVVTGVDFDVEYRMTIDVSGDRARFRLSHGTSTLAAFDADYASFPYAPDRKKPVRVGVSTGGTDWTMRDFRVRLRDEDALTQRAPAIP